jgi:hypothetical protein
LVDGLLEQQPSPFKRLKKVDVQCNRESFKVPAHVTNYLLAGTIGQELHLEVITFHFHFFLHIHYFTSIRGMSTIDRVISTSIWKSICS